MNEFTRVSDYEEYLRLSAAFRASHGKTSGNLYMLPDEMKRYIELGRMYAYTDENGLYLLCDEGKYYQLHMSASGSCRNVPFPKDKPVVARIIYKDETESAFLAVSAFLEEAGFNRRDITVEMRLKPAELKPELSAGYEAARRFVERRGFSAFTADYSRKDEIDALRESALDPLHFRYETEEEEQREYNLGRFNCIADSEGRIIATHRYEVFGKRATGHVIAVEEKYRRMGLAPLLVYGFLTALAEEGVVQNVNCWVISDNEPSLQMHGRIGFKLTGKKSLQMVYNGLPENMRF